MAKNQNTALSAEDAAALIPKLISQQLSGVMATAGKATYIASKMADLPKAYSNQLPESSDPNVLAAAEQTIRQAYRDDFAKTAQMARDRGYLPANLYNPEAIAAAVGNATDPASLSTYDAMKKANAAASTPAASTAAPIDLSKYSLEQILAMELTPVAGLRGPGARTAATTPGVSPATTRGLAPARQNPSAGMSLEQTLASGLNKY